MYELKYKSSWVKFDDCLSGLKELPDKSIDLCLTDPPYNVEFKGKAYGGQSYEDSMNKMDYINWCKEWFEELKRISTMQVIFCGNPNVPYWCKFIEIPTDIAVWYKKNCQGVGSGYYLVKHDMILMYGKFKRRLSISVIEQLIKHECAIIHPCPSNRELYERIVRELQPTSVIDPFMGSGTTLEVSIRLGIPCFGFEKNREYSIDIENSIERGKTYKKKTSLENWFLNK